MSRKPSKRQQTVLDVLCDNLRRPQEKPTSYSEAYDRISYLSGVANHAGIEGRIITPPKPRKRRTRKPAPTNPDLSPPTDWQRRELDGLCDRLGRPHERPSTMGHATRRINALRGVQPQA